MTEAGSEESKDENRSKSGYLPADEGFRTATETTVDANVLSSHQSQIAAKSSIIEPLDKFKFKDPKFTVDLEVFKFEVQTLKTKLVVTPNFQIEETLQISNDGVTFNGNGGFVAWFTMLQQEVMLELPLQVFIGFRPGGLEIFQGTAANKYVLKLFASLLLARHLQLDPHQP